MTELLLHGLALKKLQIINQQHVDGLEIVLERQGIAHLQRRHEVVHEAFRGDVKHLPVRVQIADAPSNGVDQVGFAEAGRRMNKQRVEAHRCAGAGLCDAHGGRMGQGV